MVLQRIFLLSALAVGLSVLIFVRCADFFFPVCLRVCTYRYDTRLTARGQAEASRAARQVSRLRQKPDLLVVSPLTRALQTAILAYGQQPQCPVHVEPLWRERLYLSSDVGRQPQQLQQEYPQ